MTDHAYVWIPNWDGPTGFQHYKNRDPKWIKCYTRLLNHDAYMDLTFSRRGILHGIWLEYASSARRLRGDTLSLTRRLGQKVTKADIESLRQAGFIELIASDLLAKRLQAASPEVEEEREIEQEQPSPSSTQTPEPEPEPLPKFVGTGAAAGRDENEGANMSRLPERINPDAVLHTIARGAA